LPNKLKAGLQPHNSLESTFQKIKINYAIIMGKEAKELKAASSFTIIVVQMQVC